MYEIRTSLDMLWLEIGYLKHLIQLCEDGFYQRKTNDIDMVVSVMKCCYVLVERLLKTVSDMIIMLEQEEIRKMQGKATVPDKSQ